MIYVKLVAFALASMVMVLVLASVLASVVTAYSPTLAMFVFAATLVIGIEVTYALQTPHRNQ